VAAVGRVVPGGGRARRGAGAVRTRTRTQGRSFTAEAFPAQHRLDALFDCLAACPDDDEPVWSEFTALRGESYLRLSRHRWPAVRAALVELGLAGTPDAPLSLALLDDGGLLDPGDLSAALDVVVASSAAQRVEAFSQASETVSPERVEDGFWSLVELWERCVRWAHEGVGGCRVG
jgi:hypothetical protein